MLNVTGPVYSFMIPKFTGDDPVPFFHFHFFSSTHRGSLRKHSYTISSYRYVFIIKSPLLYLTSIPITLRCRLIINDG